VASSFSCHARCGFTVLRFVGQRHYAGNALRVKPFSAPALDRVGHGVNAQQKFAADDVGVANSPSVTTSNATTAFFHAHLRKEENQSV
jgi:hypothetical protein